MDEREKQSARGRSAAPRGRSASAPALGLRGMLLFLWRRLTSMQTALILLLLLAIAAVPGSLYPQRAVNAGLTDSFLAENGGWGEFLDSIGMFDVFTSPWFSAIYILLFISLIGCIVPRIIAHAKQLRSAPPRTPARLTRFVGHREFDLPGVAPEVALERAESALRRSRMRTARYEERRSASVSGERGHLRESGNLLFHIALVAVLVCVAGGHLTNYRGQITVVEGEGFSNSLARYDSFRSGAWFDRSQLPDFRFTLEDFRAEYDAEPGSHDFGKPRSYQADVRVSTPDGEPFDRTVQVNKPLSVRGADVFLLGNGYAPEVTVRDAKGTVVAEGPVVTIPRGDLGMTSQLVIKAPDAQPEQTAVVGFFLPTGRIDQKGPHSVFPDLLDPQLAMTVYRGDLGLDEGVPKNVYQVDLASLKPLTGEDGAPALIRLKPGERADLPDGSSISFEGVRRYAAFDVAHNPFEVWTLVSALTATGGLLLSLFVPRRRMWVRVVPTECGSRVEVAGLARTEDLGLADAVDALAQRLEQPQRQEDPTTRRGVENALDTASESRTAPEGDPDS